MSILTSLQKISTVNFVSVHNESFLIHAYIRSSLEVGRLLAYIFLGKRWKPNYSCLMQWVQWTISKKKKKKRSAYLVPFFLACIIVQCHTFTGRFSVHTEIKYGLCFRLLKWFLRKDSLLMSLFLCIWWQFCPVGLVMPARALCAL